MDTKLFPGVRKWESGWDYCINVGPKALDSSRVEGRLLHVRGDCDKDSIAMPVSSVFREMDTRLFPVFGARKGWDYCVDEKYLPRLEMVWARTLRPVRGRLIHDSDCKSGLTCFQRDGYEAVPCRKREKWLGLLRSCKTIGLFARWRGGSACAGD